MNPHRVRIYQIPVLSIGMIAASSIFLIAISRVWAKPISTFPLFYPLLLICSAALCFQILSWWELTPDGITERRFYFHKTIHPWTDLHKFGVMRWKGTTTFVLLFGGFETKVSISSPAINIQHLRHFINNFANKPNLLFNGQGESWLSQPEA